MKDYESYDGLGLAELVKKGEVDAQSLLDAAIERAERLEPTLGTIVFRMFEEAREAIRAGLPKGPFEGVPFLLKDLHLAWPGVPMTNGSKLFEDFVPDVESELVTRYRAAGLVVFGKTHSPEFGLTTSTESRLYGQTRNPWNPAHTSGGSSGGSSAAVAAGYTPLANASDGGGSIRIPAACCGLFGLKPTRGQTPAGPLAGEGWSGMACVHAVTRSVRDSAALLDATAGVGFGAPYAAQPSAESYLAATQRDPGRLRIAVQTQAWNDFEPDADCQAALEDAAELCASLGHEVVHEPFRVDPAKLGLATMTIITAQTLQTIEERAAALGRPPQEDDVEPVTWELAQIAHSRSAAHYVDALQTIHRTGLELARFLQRFDVILSPTMATAPLPLGVLSLSNPDRDARAQALLQTVGYTQLANAAGNPSMSVPLYWAHPEAGRAATDPGSLPIGVQFTGRLDDESTLYALAAQLETARPWFDRRADMGALLR